MRAVQTVGAKGDMFGLADGGSVITGVSRGAPVKAVMAITNSSPYSLTGRADPGITTMKDIEGKTIAWRRGEAGLQLLPGLFAKNGVDIEKVKILRVDGGGKMVAVAEKRVEGLMGGLDNQSLTLPKRRPDHRFRLRQERRQHCGTDHRHQRRPHQARIRILSNVSSRRRCAALKRPRMNRMRRSRPERRSRQTSTPTCRSPSSRSASAL